MSETQPSFPPFQSAAQAVLEEVARTIGSTDPYLPADFLRELRSARRVAVYGAGREGLVMQALAMRLHHAGKDVFVVGAMNAQPVGEGDLLLVSAGPGKLATVSALLTVASSAGARTLVFTAQPQGETSILADTVLQVPAQTMADDQVSSVNTLPMGSLYELSLWLLCDLLVEAFIRADGISADALRARHTNLE